MSNKNNPVKILLTVLILFFSDVSIASSKQNIEKNQGQMSSGKSFATYSVTSTASEELIKWADENTIIFITLDDTITTPKSAMFSHGGNIHRGFIDNLIALGKSQSNYIVAASQWYQQREVRLVQPEWADFINKLHRKKPSIYGIVKMPMQLINIEKKLLSELSGFGIEFTPTINSKKEMLIKQESNWASRFYKGLILTGPYGQSNTLFYFLKAAKIKNKKIAIIDSRKEYVTNLKTSFESSKTPYFSLLYLGVKKNVSATNEKVINFQQNELMKNGRWIEDDEALQILNSYSK